MQQHAPQYCVSVGPCQQRAPHPHGGAPAVQLLQWLRQRLPPLCLSPSFVCTAAQRPLPTAPGPARWSAPPAAGGPWGRACDRRWRRSVWAGLLKAPALKLPPLPLEPHHLLPGPLLHSLPSAPLLQAPPPCLPECVCVPGPPQSAQRRCWRRWLTQHWHSTPRNSDRRRLLSRACRLSKIEKQSEVYGIAFLYLTNVDQLSSNMIFPD